jgi:tRNA threonylcarbamoyladenosine biosynthesis protein TsaE
MAPILDQNSLEIISRSAEQTRRVGMRLGSLLQPGDVICLCGDLGAGKTTFVQGLAAGWGSLDQVTSPTFVLVNLYRRMDQRRLYHLDAYRLTGPSEAIDLDFDEMLYQGSLVIEWADRIEAALPKERLWVSLQWMEDTHRDLMFSACGGRYYALLVAFREQVYGVP